MLGKPDEHPSVDRRAMRHDTVKADIVVKAWEIAAEQGLAAMSLRDLARRVGMRAPSLYSYFDSKNAIYDAMYAQGAREFVVREAEIDYTGDALPDLKSLGHFFMSFCSEDPVRYQLLFQRTIPGFEPSAESFAISEQYLEAIQQRFAAIGLDEPRTIDLFTAIGTGLTDQQISNDPGGDRWSRLVDEAAEMFYHHVTSTKSDTKARARS